MVKRALLIPLVVVLVASCGGGTPTGVQGVRGQVLLGPTCPVEQAGSPCPNQPVSAVVVVIKKVGEPVASVRTDASGRFFVPLQSGSYLIYANERSDNPRHSPFRPISVRAGEVLRLELVIDTGIR